MTRSAKRSARVPSGVAGDSVREAAARKPGAHREATLYRALNGAGAGPGSPDELRARAREAFETLELPVWRRSGFWTTSLRDLDVDALSQREASAVPGFVDDVLGDEELAGVIVQSGSSVVRVELDPELPAKGVLFCALDAAPAELRDRYLSKRLTIDRDKVEAAAAAFWTGGAFLYVPRGLVVDKPFQVVYALEEAGTAQYGHTLVVGDEQSDFRFRQYKLAGDFEGQALHAGQLELYLEAGAPARGAPLQDWSNGEGYDVSTQFVGGGRDAHAHLPPSDLGGPPPPPHPQPPGRGAG